jgi:predicted MFS family arabinose efflux permease
VTTEPSHAARAPLRLDTILGLSIAAVVALGFARFAYALLLPAMRAELGWSYAEAGALNTANAAGYLAGALVTAAVSARAGAPRAFVAGLVVTALALLASGAADDFALLVSLRTLAGFAGALSFVVGAVLAAHAGTGAPRERQGLFIAVYFAGGGTGMAASGALVPLALELGGGWRGGWLALGAVACLLVPVAWRAARAVGAPAVPPLAPSVGRAVSLRATFMVYTLFGAGYIAYMTFIIAFLRGASADSTTVAWFWIVLGLASVGAGFLWGRLFARLPGGWPQATVLIVNALGAALPLAGMSTATLLASALLFGATVMAMPSAVTAFVRKSLPEAAWTAALARLTVVFGLGQCLGPLLSGYLSDGALGLSAGLVLSAGILLVAATIAAFQPEPRAAPEARPVRAA